MHTADEASARTAALAATLAHADTFARQHAQLTPLVQTVISPALADELARRARIRILAMDDAIRYSPDALGEFLTLFAPEPTRYFSEASPLATRPAIEVGPDGMTPEQLQALGRVHQTLTLGLSSSLAAGQLKFGEQDAAREAAELGLSADWSRNRPAVLTILRAVIGAWIDVGTPALRVDTMLWTLTAQGEVTARVRGGPGGPEVRGVSDLLAGLGAGRTLRIEPL